MLEKLQKAIQDGADSMALAKVLGFRVTAVHHGESIIEMESTGDHANPMGTLHGGVLCTIADSAMGIAHLSTLEEGEATTTLELKINFLRPVWSEKLRAFGRVVKSGRTISLVEADVLDEQGRLVARASSTCMTLRGEQANRRPQAAD